ncbi:mannosyltransferase [Schizosaccharomyces japonicus yFS275]|uniref:Mannosyltransferase n=1 Tax=Schizosaccharomyces japonicus (strain yFS275 / FY16936) TaxID=402676 RepID=B6K1Q6_SCHJY|nr:mannosyltransferase [Schizosaccharomyces japonicus yFS275]EEB07087.1 mannosyltransferase [Schizosaccharomyces japonicus yFS275]
MKRLLYMGIAAFIISAVVGVRLFFVPIRLMLFDNFKDDIILRGDVDYAANETSLWSNETQIVPKIIHQTWKNSDVPEKWKDAQRSCQDLHPDYEYKLWTDEDIRAFIAKEYPWFLEQFDSYPFGIMRADVVRYFILYHYGGIYLDFDVGCKRSLDPLLKYPSFLRTTTPVGISNNVMTSVKGHPFFLMTIRYLKKYAFNYHFPYLTVMYSTGPLFLSAIWRLYRDFPIASPLHRIRIMMPDMYTGQDWSFFNVFEGSSWHEEDAGLVFWLLRHWLALTIICSTIFLLLIHFAFGDSCRRSNRAGRGAVHSPSLSSASSAATYVVNDKEEHLNVPFMKDYDEEASVGGGTEVIFSASKKNTE